MNRWKFITPLAMLVSAWAPNAVLAWGSEGHQVVALIAEAKLNAKARAEVGRLLALEPGQSLASVSTWADEHRNPATVAWHYINFPRGTCQYVAERDCPDGKCVVGAIDRQVEVLKSSESDERRLVALKYLVHFVADVHQPLHAGYADDRGGNSYQLQANMRGTNLHALWDKWLIDSLEKSPEVMATRLMGRARTGGEGAGRGIEVLAAEESCRIVGMEGFYPGRKVEGDYVRRFVPVVEERLVVAGRRLATFLNGAIK